MVEAIFQRKEKIVTRPLFSGIIHTIMVRRFMLLVWATLFALPFVIAQSAPVTKLKDVVVVPSPPTPIAVDLEVTGFTTQVSSATLKFTYNPAVLTYLGVYTPNPVLPGMMLVGNPIPGEITLTYFDPMLTGVNLPASSVLVSLQFTYNGGISNLNWDLSSPTNNEWTDLTLNPMNDVPESSYYLNGIVRDALSASSSSPITYAAQVFSVPGPILFPITVDNLSYCDAISLTLDYNPAHLTYTGITNVHPALAGGTMSSASGGKFYFAWTSSGTPITSVLPNGTKLFDIQFTSLPGTSYLTWDNDPNTDCEYQDVLSQTPYPDVPTPAFYKDGFVSNLASTYTFSHVICKGANDGTITFNATGGSLTYEYSIDNGATWSPSPAFTGLSPMTYPLLVRDASFPLVVLNLGSVTIQEPAVALYVNTFESHRVRCKGEQNGQATINAFGGWGNYTYSIDGITWHTLNIFDALFPGTYTLYAKDYLGCIASGLVQIIEPTIALTASGVESKKVTCYGGSNGEITLTGYDGWGTYNYSKDDVTYQVSNVLTGFIAGTYTVYVKDKGGCVVPVVVTVTQPAAPLAITAVNSKLVSCYGYSDGEITATATGGWGSYQYSIDNGTTWQVSNLFTGLAAGPYTILVKDFEGCIVMSSVTMVVQPDQLEGVLSGTTTVCYGTNATVTVTIAGGTPPYTFVVTDGVTPITVTNHPTTVYTFTQAYTQPTTWTWVSLTDANSCSSTLSGNAVISIFPLPVVSDATLLTSVDQTNWSNVGGTFPAFTMCIDPVIPYHYLDINTLTVGPNGLLTGSFTQNAFYLNTGSVPGNFISYWAAKGVVSGATGWQGVMWNIINGTAPMFYINYTGSDYTLIDGLQWQAFGNPGTLRITGDYPQGSYTFNGTVTDINGCISVPFNIGLQMNSSPVVTDVTLTTSVDQINWSSVGGTFSSGYEMCIDPVIPYHYMDINTFTVGINSLLANSFTQNAFYLNTGTLPGNFYNYWAAKGVVTGATGWQGVMWNIINGTSPMFYVNYDGSDYTLIDGLQYDAFNVTSTLRISGDYPQGNYIFSGSVTDANGCASSPFSINLQLNSSPVVADVTLITSVDQTNWSAVGGSFTGGYTMCIDPVINYHYLDINTLSVGVNTLMTNNLPQNAFYLNTATVPGNFYSYWAAKGVVSGATGWQGVMWNIINGTAPMFYINYDGSDYSLIDGLQYQMGGGTPVLRISGDYPQGNYGFTGTVADINGCVSSPFSITLQMNSSPVVTDVTMQESEDLLNWNPVNGTFAGGYTLCLDAMAQYHYLDINTLSVGVNGLLQNSFSQNAFYLDPTSVPGNFYSYWAAKGVVSGATGWQGVMWNIIDGTAPMFYINYDGSDYTLIDGLQYQFGALVSTLRVSGDYPVGTYTFKGTVTDANGCASSPFAIDITFNHKPLVSFGFNGVEAGHNATFQYCYDTPVGVTLYNIYDGVAPFSVTYEVNGVNSTVTGLNIGSVVFPSQILAPNTYSIVVTNITDANGCSAGPAFLALCQATVIIHDEPMISFGFNGVEAGHNATFEYCYDQPVGVTLYAQYGGTAPYSVTYTVNGGTPVTVTGLNVGDPIIAPQTYTAGMYSVVVTNITDVYGCVASPAFLALCQALVTINPEPAVGFSFNGNLAGTGTIFNFCYSDLVTVKLSDIWSGTAPFDVAWTVNGVPASATGLNLNDNLFSNYLTAGTYVVQITSIIDAKGCSPASYVPYTATVNIHKINVSGYFKYHNLAETPLNNVTVNLKQGTSTLYTMPTDQTGYYEFQGVCPGTYSIEATTIKPVIGAINSTDAIQVNIWGATPVPIEKVRYRAGDVNAPFNFLDPGDALSILSYFVNNGTPAFSPSWVFWQANDITAVNGTVLTPLPVLNVGFANIIQDFYGLVNGDFNRSFTPGNAKSNGQINLQQVSSLKLEQASTIDVPVTAGMNMNLTAISMILNYPSDKVEIVDVALGNMAAPVLWKAVNGELRIGYANVAPVWFQNGETVLTIKVKATGLKTGDVITFTLTPSNLNEIADATAEVIPGALLNISAIEGTVGIPGNTGNELLSISAWPNPFGISSKINYTLPEYGHVALEVFDLTGRKVMTLVDQMQQAGVFTVSLDAVNLPAGVYNTRLTLVTSEGQVDKSVRMIRNK